MATLPERVENIPFWGFFLLLFKVMVVSGILPKQSGLMVPNTISGLSLFYAYCVGSKLNLLICPLVKTTAWSWFPCIHQRTTVERSRSTHATVAQTNGSKMYLILLSLCCAQHINWNYKSFIKVWWDWPFPSFTGQVTPVLQGLGVRVGGCTCKCAHVFLLWFVHACSPLLHANVKEKNKDLYFVITPLWLVVILRYDFRMCFAFHTFSSFWHSSGSI